MRRAGEGVIGLSWALFVAGCPTTVVSQWKVRSDSTAELMVEFHRQLKARSAKRPVTVAEALRTAALKLPAAEAAEARFHLLEAAQAATLLRAQKSYRRRHLTLAVLYAEAGLLEEAERELQALSTANPGSQFSQKLLQELRAQRR